MVASSLASSTGLRPGTTSTLGPNFRRRVRPAAAAIEVRGPKVGPLTRSENHSESQPSDSQVSTIDQKLSPSTAAAAVVPSPKPILIFIVGTLLR